MSSAYFLAQFAPIIAVLPRKPCSELRKSMGGGPHPDLDESGRQAGSSNRARGRLMKQCTHNDESEGESLHGGRILGGERIAA